MKESPIFAKTQTYIVWLLERTVKFPKSQRFIMARRVYDTALDFQESLIKAAKARDPVKQLKTADVQLEILRKHIRTCVELKLLSIKQYEYSSDHLVEIGKLLGGWINSRSRHSKGN